MKSGWETTTTSADTELKPASTSLVPGACRIAGTRIDAGEATVYPAATPTPSNAAA